MYGFLILLPLTLVSLLIGSAIALSPQVADYVAYATDISGQKITLQEVWSNKRALIQIGAHLLAYIVMCFAALATARTISAPLPPDRPALLRFFQVSLEAIFVALPSLVLLWVSIHAMRLDWDNLVHRLTIGVLILGIIITVSLTAFRRPLELYNSKLASFSITKTDIFGALSAIIIGAAVAAFALYPIEAAYTVGMFPVLMLVTAATNLVLAAVFSRWASPVAVVSTAITCVVILHLIDALVLPAREFRYKTIAAKAADKDLAVSDVKAQRSVPDLPTAFLAWLEHRRPAIEAYKKEGRLYPIFFVSAQGGGIYAAYHPALSLARLTDQCPEFAHHLFGISSVSGGSLGAAVYSELMHAVPKTPQNDPSARRVGCTATDGPNVDNTLQTRVHKFFEADFLSPVIASAFLFDIPGLLIPQLRFGQDRAKALEHGFEVDPAFGDGWAARRKAAASCRGCGFRRLVAGGGFEEVRRRLDVAAVVKARGKDVTRVSRHALVEAVDGVFRQPEEAVSQALADDVARGGSGYAHRLKLRGRRVDRFDRVADVEAAGDEHPVERDRV